MRKRALCLLASLYVLCSLLPASALAAMQAYSVSFDANGGSGSMESQAIVAQEETTLIGNEFVRAGYHFVGWNTSADGMGTTYADRASISLTSDLLLYAQWEPYSARWAFGTQGCQPQEADYTDGTLEAAFAAANGNEETSITYVTLNTNVTAVSCFELAAGKSMVLDLNGNTIQVTSDQGAVYGIYTNHNSCLTLRNGGVSVRQIGISQAYGVYTKGNLVMDSCTISVTSDQSTAYGIRSSGTSEITASTISAESIGSTAYGVYSDGDVDVSNSELSALAQETSYGIYAAGIVQLSGTSAISGGTADIYINGNGQIWANNRENTPTYYTGATVELCYARNIKHDETAVYGVTEENRNQFELTASLGANYSLASSGDALVFCGRILALEWFDSQATTQLTGSEYPETIHYGQTLAPMPELQEAGLHFEGWYYCEAGNTQWSSTIWDETDVVLTSMKLKAGFGSAIGSGTDGARIYYAANGDVFLGGDYIELGLRPSGVFGTAAQAPTDGSVVFHPTHYNRIGLRSNGNQKWSLGLATGEDATVDFFLPTTIDEGWMVGWTTDKEGRAAARGGAQSYGSRCGDLGVVSTAPIEARVNTVDGQDTLVASTSAWVSDTLAVAQQISFAADEKYFTTTVTLTNNSSKTLYDLSYIRAFDPDQRAEYASGHTDNYFYQDGDGNVWVIAFGNNSLNVGNTLTAVDYATMVTSNENAVAPFAFCAQAPAAGCGYTVQAVNTRVDWDYTDYGDFYRSSRNSLAGDDLYGKHYYVDRGIGLEFVVAALDAGQSVTFSWMSSLDTNTNSAVASIQEAVQAPVPEIATTSLPNATVGTANRQALATVDLVPANWTLGQGALPDGLSLLDGVICGVPTRSGTFSFTVQTTNAYGSDTKELTIVVEQVYVEPTYRVVVEPTDGGQVKTNGSWFWRGETVTITALPEDGYVVAGISVMDSRSQEISVCDKGQGKYTFRMPARKVTVTVTFHRCPSLDYPDVDTSNWYHECIDYVLEHNLVDAVADAVFAPDGIATRAMLVVAIWRNEGSTVVDYAMHYTDLDENLPYEQAVRWATSVGIVEGFPDGSFRGDEAITREQMAAAFYRYERFRGEGYTEDWDYQLSYADADAVGAWAYEAVCWNTFMGVVQGDGVNFDPKGTATRAHVSQLLMNYLER